MSFGINTIKDDGAETGSHNGEFDGAIIAQDLFNYTLLRRLEAKGLSLAADMFNPENRKLVAKAIEEAAELMPFLEAVQKGEIPDETGSEIAEITGFEGQLDPFDNTDS